MNENPYSPFDPHWYIMEAYLRKKRQRKLQVEIHKFFVSFRKRRMHLIFTTPNIAFDVPQFLAKRARRSFGGKGDMIIKLGKCGYLHNPFECQKMPCYDGCKNSELTEKEK